MKQRLIFELRYLRRKAPWDTGISPPELLTHLERTPPGRALDLGCGTGTNAITMASLGWRVTAVDISALAIRTARKKSEQQGFTIDFRRENVLDLHFGTGQFDLVLDIGCFHSLQPPHRKIYAKNLAAWIHPEGTFLLYSWIGPDPVSERDLPEKDELIQIFSFAELVEFQRGRDQSAGWTSAWITMRPKPS